MKRFVLLFISFVLLFMSSCAGHKENTNHSSAVADSSSSSAVSTQSSSGRIQNHLVSKDDAKLSDREKRYYSLAVCIELVSPLIFTDPSETPSKNAYYLYLILKDQENKDWLKEIYNEKTKMYSISVVDIRNVLKKYVGKENFDPNEAFKDEIASSAGEVGYHSDTDTYYSICPEEFGGYRYSGMVKFLNMVNDTYEITVGYYKDQTLSDAYMTQTLTIKENSDGTFLIKKAYYTYYQDDGSVDVIDTYEKYKTVKQPGF